MQATHEEIIRDHAGAAARYAAYWADPCARPEDLTEEETAYELLLHTGLVHRYSGDLTGLRLLRGLPDDDRSRLVTAACSFLASTNYAAEAERLAEEAMIDDSAGEEYAQYVYERDQMDVVIMMAKTIGFQVVNRVPAASEAFDRALDATVLLDDVLEEHITLTVEYSDTVLYLWNHVVVDRDVPNAWWAPRLLVMQQKVFAPDPVSALLQQAKVLQDDDARDPYDWVLDLLGNAKKLIPKLPPKSKRGYGDFTPAFATDQPSTHATIAGHLTVVIWIVDKSGACDFSFHDRARGLKALSFDTGWLVLRRGAEEIQRWEIRDAVATIDDVPGLMGNSLFVLSDKGEEIGMVVLVRD